MVGVFLDGVGWWVVQPFYHVNRDRFLPLPLECRKCNTSCALSTPRATPTSTGDWTTNIFNQCEIRNMNRESEKQNLIGQKARKLNWRTDRGHWKVAVTTLAAIQYESEL
jgi:hypothetical protein